MTSVECRAIISLSSIMGLRMIGLFMVLPVFTLYATHLVGATPALIGLSMGIYGLFQALLQIPFGMLSDRLGRKPIILIGLLLFSLGSLIAAKAQTIEWMIIGRSLQGAGAIGGTTLALIADLTRESERSKAMAIAGISIGFAFSLAMLLGPLLTQWIAINDLFLVACGCGLAAIFILYRLVPTPKKESWHRDTEPDLTSVKKLFFSAELAKLNSGIFILHAVFTASFIIIPLQLMEFTHFAAREQWKLYLPTLLLAFILSLLCIGWAERRQQVKPFFLLGISMMLMAQSIFAFSSTFYAAILSLTLFFTGFSLLEAFLPSLISRTAPASRKGSALGIYSCAQFFGIFVGGTLGGWLFGKFSFAGVYFLCIMLTLFWLLIAYFMQPPRYLVNQMWPISPAVLSKWNNIAAKLRAIPGVVEVTFITEESVAYLKLEKGCLKHPDFISLKAHTLDPL